MNHSSEKIQSILTFVSNYIKQTNTFNAISDKYILFAADTIASPLPKRKVRKY